VAAIREREDGRSPVEQEDDAGEICHIRWDRPKPPNPLRTSKRRGISTPSLSAQGEQRRSSYFNIDRDNFSPYGVL
jgi:hypothetical protein